MLSTSSSLKGDIGELGIPRAGSRIESAMVSHVTYGLKQRRLCDVLQCCHVTCLNRRFSQVICKIPERGDPLSGVPYESPVLHLRNAHER